MNFDGLVGQTHNYAGLSPGNLASEKHRGAVSSPRRAALQGLAKMRRLMELGLTQGVLPPQERPDVWTLRRLGLGKGGRGTDAEVIEEAARRSPALLSACSSGSSMWTANAATVAPSADTGDGRVHLTPANLVAHLHRALEDRQTERALRAIFREGPRFRVHAPLPSVTAFGDEGAANHIRLCARHAEPGVQVFVYGRCALEETRERIARTPGASGAPRREPPADPRKYVARQTLEASEAIARLHGLSEERTLFVRQNPDVIDAGVFHNDVISVGNENVLLYHERAFAEGDAAIDGMRQRLRGLGADLVEIRVTEEEVSVEEAVATYLFNSQIVTLPGGGMMLVCPGECERSERVRRRIDRMLADDNPVERVEFFDLRESMRNGGGPACLRLRVALTDEELAAVNPGAILTPTLVGELEAWVRRHYREELRPADLADPRLVDETRRALAELTEMLGLGAIYPFQMER